MATASTSKKIQRVQQSGVTRRTGQRRPVGFPAAVVGIIIVGLVLVWFARDARINVNGEQPRPNRDSWYEAYGTYVCGEYLANPAAPAEETDITTKGNGLIDVFPTSTETAGANATIDKFFDAVGFEVGTDSFTVGDKTYSAGDECGEGDDATTDTVVKLFVWPPQASNDTEPLEIRTKDFGSARFEQNNEIYALALVPESTNEIDLPPSVANLANPEAGIPETTIAPTETTVAADPAATTVPGETTVAPVTTAAPTTTAG